MSSVFYTNSSKEHLRQSDIRQIWQGRAENRENDGIKIFKKLKHIAINISNFKKKSRKTYQLNYFIVLGSYYLATRDIKKIRR
jgi:hypothetical protein